MLAPLADHVVAEVSEAFESKPQPAVPWPGSDPAGYYSTAAALPALMLEGTP